MKYRSEFRNSRKQFNCKIQSMRQPTIFVSSVHGVKKNVKKWKSRTPDRKRFHLVKIWLTAKRLAIFTLNNAVSTSAISRWGLDRIKKKEKL